MSDLDRTNNRGKTWAVTACVVVAAVACIFFFLFYKDRQEQPVDLPLAPSQEESSAPAPEPSQPEPEPEVSVPTSSSQVPSSRPSTPPVTNTPQPTMVTIDQPGTFSNPGTYRQIVITSPDVLLKNKTVTGNLFIMDEVGEGDVTLENVVVEGTLYIYGGGENTITLRDVQADRVHLQKDSGTLGVLATGSTSLENVLLKCHALLTQESLTGTGFARLSIEESQKVWYEVALRDVAMQSLTVNAPANVNLSRDSRVDAVYANQAVHFTGGGKIDALQVRHNRVSYETAPRTLDVKHGYEQPVHGGYAIGQPEPDSGTSGSGGSSGGSSTALRLSTPTDLILSYDGEQNALVASFSPVQRSGGYLVTPYLKTDALGVALPAISLQGSENTHCVVLANPQQYLGQELQVKVKALGDSAQNTQDSYEASTAYTAIARLDSPKGLTTTLLETTGGLRYRVSWDAVPGRCGGYTLTATYQGLVNRLRTDTNSVEFSFDRSGETADRAFAFSVVAHPREDSTLLDSLPSAPLPVELTILPEPAARCIVLLEDGSLAARWTFPEGQKNVESFTFIPCVDSVEGTAVTVPLATAESPLPAQGYYQQVLLTAAQVEEKLGSTLSFKVRANASPGHVSSAYVSPAGITLARDLPAPTGLETFYSATARTVGGEESPAGYYYRWQAVPGAAGYRVTPILIRDGEEHRYAPVDLPAEITSVRAWSKTGTKAAQGVETPVAFREGDRLSFQVESISGQVGHYPMQAAVCPVEKQAVISQLPTPEGLTLTGSRVYDTANSPSGWQATILATWTQPKSPLPQGCLYQLRGYQGEEKVYEVELPVGQTEHSIPALEGGKIMDRVELVVIAPGQNPLDSRAVSAPVYYTLSTDSRLALLCQWEGENLNWTLNLPVEYAGSWTLSIEEEKAGAFTVLASWPVETPQPTEGQTAFVLPLTLSTLPENLLADQSIRYVRLTHHPVKGESGPALEVCSLPLTITLPSKSSSTVPSPSAPSGSSTAPSSSAMPQSSSSSSAASAQPAS